MRQRYDSLEMPVVEGGGEAETATSCCFGTNERDERESNMLEVVSKQQEAYKGVVAHYEELLRHVLDTVKL